MVAAWLELIPGRKEHNGATRTEVSAPLMVSLSFQGICFRVAVVCFGREILCFMLIKRAEVPNKPVSRGRRGSLTGREKVKYPKNPDKRKTIRDVVNFFERKIIANEIKIRRNGMRL